MKEDWKKETIKAVLFVLLILVVGTLTLGTAAAYIVAALVPALVVAMISKEMRVPFLTEYEEHDVVVREFNVLKAA